MSFPQPENITATVQLITFLCLAVLHWLNDAVMERMGSEPTDSLPFSAKTIGILRFLELAVVIHLTSFFIAIAWNAFDGSRGVLNTFFGEERRLATIFQLAALITALIGARNLTRWLNELKYDEAAVSTED